MTCRIAVIFFTILASIAGAKTLGEIEKSQQATLLEIETNAIKEVDKLGKLLISALDRAKQAETAAGNVKSAQSYEDEIARMMFDSEPFAKPSSLAAIAKMEAVYTSEFVDLEQQRQRKIVEWYIRYDTELESLQKSLTTAEANEISDKRDALKEREMVKSAVAAVANAKHTNKRAETPSSQPAPASNKPWKFLKRVKWAKAEGGEYFKSMLEEDRDIIKDGKKYRLRQFIFCHPPGMIEYQFDEPITGFTASACLEERSTNGNIIFIVETDEGEVYRSKPVDKGRNREEIEINFKPSKKLVLRTDEHGSGAEDWAFWLLPRYR